METTSTSKNENVDEQITRMIPAGWKNDKAFTNYARAIHSVAYFKLGRGNLQRYMKFIRIDKCEELLLEEPRKIEDEIGEFLAQGCMTISNRSKRVVFANLKLFYTQNDVNLNWSKLSKRIGPREKSRNRGYDDEEIKQMLEHAGQRERVVILLLASTGMRLGALPDLKIGDLKPIEHEIHGKFYAVTVYRGEPEEYLTFCSPECARAIDHYIEFRKTIREPVKQSSPLIRNQVDIKTAENNPDYRLAKGLQLGGMRSVIEKIAKGSGVKGKLSKTTEKNDVNRYEKHLTRGFRKFYFRAMVKAKVEPIHRHALMGHRDGTMNIEASQLAMIYDAPEESELFASYVKAIDYLTIDKSLALARENEDLKGKLETTSILRKELQDIKGELFDEMDKRLKITKRIQIPQKHMVDYINYTRSKMTPEELEELERVQEAVMEEWEREASGLPNERDIDF